MWYHDCNKGGFDKCIKPLIGKFDKRWVIDKEYDKDWNGTTGIFGTFDENTYWPFDIRCCDNKESETDAKIGWYFWMADLEKYSGPFGEAQTPAPGDTHISVKRVPIFHSHTQNEANGEPYNRISKMLSIFA